MKEKKRKEDAVLGIPRDMHGVLSKTGFNGLAFGKQPLVNFDRSQFESQNLPKITRYQMLNAKPLKPV